VRTNGLGYPAVIVRNMDESLEFYQRLGLKLLFVEPNRDDAESAQALLSAGGETFLMLIGPVDPNMKLAEATLGVGSMQYLSFRVSGEQMDRMFHEMSTAGLHGSEQIERGYERLVFMEDPNGTLILLTTWVTEPPPGLDRARVLARAAQFRDADRTPFVEDRHVRQAIAELQATS
jgi:catechol 2,3-dioxygenase-like lactoylglutathione lyase family enzyme